jgi:hypothetical protein
MWHTGGSIGKNWRPALKISLTGYNLRLHKENELALADNRSWMIIMAIINEAKI